MRSMALSRLNPAITHGRALHLNLGPGGHRRGRRLRRGQGWHRPTQEQCSHHREDQEERGHDVQGQEERDQGQARSRTARSSAADLVAEEERTKIPTLGDGGEGDCIWESTPRRSTPGGTAKPPNYRKDRFQEPSTSAESPSPRDGDPVAMLTATPAPSGPSSQTASPSRCPTDTSRRPASTASAARSSSEPKVPLWPTAPSRPARSSGLPSSSMASPSTLPDPESPSPRPRHRAGTTARWSGSPSTEQDVGSASSQARRPPPDEGGGLRVASCSAPATSSVARPPHHRSWSSS